MSYRCVLFDLDGTLVDTSPGIIASLRNLEEMAGLPHLPEETMHRFIGPPLLDSMMAYYQVDRQRALELVALYRRDYSAGGFCKARVYPKVEEILELLREKGVLRVVATLKQEYMAHGTLRTHGLEDAFDLIVGSPPEGQEAADHPHTKGEQITWALNQLGVPAGQAVMIGDSSYDGIGAREAGVDFVAQQYGYAFAHGEPRGDYPQVASVATPEELWNFLMAHIF